MNPQPIRDPETEPSPRKSNAVRFSIGQAVHAVAGALERDEIGPGDAAALRRVTPEDPSSPALWKVLAQYVVPYWSLPAGGPALDDAERRWAVILNAIAHLRGLHAPAIRLGAALRDAGFSELRFVRLLRAEDDRVADAVRTTARFLASKGQPANLTELADLVLSDGHPKAERVRRHIARSYYQSTKND